MAVYALESDPSEFLTRRSKYLEIGALRLLAKFNTAASRKEYKRKSVSFSRQATSSSQQSIIAGQLKALRKVSPKFNNWHFHFIRSNFWYQEASKLRAEQIEEGFGTVGL